MGERDAAWQKPGYDGICNYAQKITSCFGLDGKKRDGVEEEEEEVGVCVCVCFLYCGAGCSNGRSCDLECNSARCADFLSAQGRQPLLPEHVCVDLQVCGQLCQKLPHSG